MRILSQHSKRQNNNISATNNLLNQIYTGLEPHHFMDNRSEFKNQKDLCSVISNNPGIITQHNLIQQRKEKLIQKATTAEHNPKLYRLINIINQKQINQGIGCEQKLPVNNISFDQGAILQRNTVIQRLSDGEIRVQRGIIRRNQAIVNANRGTIDRYTTRGRGGRGRRRGVTRIRQNLRRTYLTQLIAALNASITARQNVVDAHTLLGEGDQGHQVRIGIERGLRTAAITDRATLNRHAAIPWQIDPGNTNRERRRRGYWDRDPIPAWEYRQIIKPKSKLSNNPFALLSEM